MSDVCPANIFYDKFLVTVVYQVVLGPVNGPARMHSTAVFSLRNFKFSRLGVAYLPISFVPEHTFYETFFTVGYQQRWLRKQCHRQKQLIETRLKPTAKRYQNDRKHFSYLIYSQTSHLSRQLFSFLMLLLMFASLVGATVISSGYHGG